MIRKAWWRHWHRKKRRIDDVTLWKMASWLTYWTQFDIDLPLDARWPSSWGLQS